MTAKKRKPNHPGVILDELYIKPLNLNFQELADHLDISRNFLFRIRTAKASITPAIAIRLAEAFDTTPNLWLNLQQNYDLWVEEHEKVHKAITPLYRTTRTIKRRSRKSTSMA
jgi:addiction module HigA family antidote